MKILKNLAAVGVLASVFFSAPAIAADETLTIHHFLPPKANAHAKMIQVWADRVQEQSKGKLKIEIFPSMAMGGKPPELHKQARDGLADIVWTLLGYTPGVFPRSEVFELPLVHTGSARATTIALNKSFDLIADDFKDVHVIFLHSHQGNMIKSVKEPVLKFEDVKGMKLRTPSRTGAWMLQSWGAEPVGMPIPALPQALAKGVVDGALTPYEIVPALKLQELYKSASTLPNGDRFGTAVFMFAMNKDRYNSLPDDLKAVIDANSRSNVAEWAGTLWEEFENDGIEAFKQKDIKTNVLSDAEVKKFNAASQTVIDRWVKEISTKGIDGAALVEKAQAAVKAAGASN